MTAKREKAKIDECLYLLSAGDKDIADKYHKELNQVQDYKTTRLEAILQVISDELGEEIERDALKAQEEAEAERKSHYKGMAVGLVPEIN